MDMENAIEPEIPICDAHHHFTNYPKDIYLLDDFLEDIGGGHNIAETVFIECKSHFDPSDFHNAHPEGETKFVEDIANRSGKYSKTRIAAGIVGFADLTLGDLVAPVLEAHLKASPDRFRGIRYVTLWNKHFQLINTVPQDILYDSKFREGFACLQKYNLSFDSFLFYTQLKELADLAKAFPQTTIILDHFGGLLGTGPYAHDREAVISEWKGGLSALAACDNVVIKLGGFALEFYGFGLINLAPLSSVELADMMAPYYIWCIEQFGPERCMFESNFQVDKKGYSYTAVWNAFKLLSRNLTSTERAALFRDTAIRVYRL